MSTVTVSPKYQIVIPPSIRRALKIRPGQKIQILEYENRIVFIPLKDIREMRGFLKGIDTTIGREK
jgi:AbrB family looped-hinge helix DNA binding protein